MSKHTPGPWKISHGCLPGDAGFSIGTNNAAARNVSIVAECWPCTIVSEDHRRELFSNARLITAAPDLLEACRQMLEGMEVEGYSCDTMDMARDAIAKAEGTTP
jgi:hypothetical protein